jgi:hypothetical protein
VLYREKEAKFMAKPKEWGEREGRRSLPLLAHGTAR